MCKRDRWLGLFMLKPMGFALMQNGNYIKIKTQLKLSLNHPEADTK